jgi:hypothetical protein
MQLFSIEWLAGNGSVPILWTTDTSTPYIIHEAALQQPQNFSAIDSRAYFYQSYYATKQVRELLYLFYEIQC